MSVINRLSALGSEAKWIIAGVGQEGKCELMQHTRHIDVEIYERVTRDELRELYQKMTVFLCLSSYESFGMVCSEAMACGCILISTRVGFAAGLKDGEEYISIDSEDDQGVAKKI